MAKILKYSDIWGSPSTTLTGYRIFGDESTLNFIHETGVFRIEFDYIHYESSIGFQHLLLTTPSNTTGLSFGFGVNSSNLTAYIRNSGTIITGMGISVPVGVKSRIKIYGNGTTAYIDVNGSILSQDYLSPFAIGDAQSLPYVGYNGSTNKLFGKLREYKIYNSFDTSSLVYHFPFKYPDNLGLELISRTDAEVVNMDIINLGDTVLKTSKLLLV